MFGWSGEAAALRGVGVTVVAALLMVSRIRYSSFKGSGDAAPRADRVPFLALVIAVAVLIALASGRTCGDIAWLSTDAVCPVGAGLMWLRSSPRCRGSDAAQRELGSVPAPGPG